MLRRWTDKPPAPNIGWKRLPNGHELPERAARRQAKLEAQAAKEATETAHDEAVSEAEEAGAASMLDEHDWLVE